MDNNKNYVATSHEAIYNGIDFIFVYRQIQYQLLHFTVHSLYIENTVIR